MIHLQNGRLKEALQLGLSEAGQAVHGTLTAIDALRLTGIACELDGRPKDAVAAFQRGLQLTGRDYPYQTLNLLLLASDAQRRAGDLLAAEPRVAGHRSLGKRSRYRAPSCHRSHPVGADLLPPARKLSLARRSPTHAKRSQRSLWHRGRPAAIGQSIALTDETPLWTAIGHWRLARNESQAALVALSAPKR